MCPSPNHRRHEDRVLRLPGLAATAFQLLVSWTVQNLGHSPLTGILDSPNLGRFPPNFSLDVESRLLWNSIANSRLPLSTSAFTAPAGAALPSAHSMWLAMRPAVRPAVRLAMRLAVRLAMWQAAWPTIPLFKHPPQTSR